MRRVLTIAFLLGLLPRVSLAQQTIVRYVDRPTWQAAVGSGLDGESFNGFTSDVSLATSVSIANGTVIVLKAPAVIQSSVNKIDAPPRQEFFSNDNYSIGDSAYLLADIAASRKVVFEFERPISAWGGDFRGLLTSFQSPTRLVVFGTDNTNFGGIEFIGDAFHGFKLSNAAASRIEIKIDGLNNDVFGLDNIQFAFAVPEPSTILLSAVAAASVFGRCRRLAMVA